MKKLIISCIICSLISFTLAGCDGINISLNSGDNSSSKETKQNQNTENKPDVSDKTTENKDKQSESVNDKSNAKDKAPQSENKQSQTTRDNPNDSPNITVNITNDTASEKKDIIVISDPIPTNIAHGSFIFSNSDCYYLTKNQVSNLNNFELGIARNEIYARHGYIFSLEQFKAYFTAQKWYRPITKNVKLNKIETYNVDLIKTEENRRGITWH